MFIGSKHCPRCGAAAAQRRDIAGQIQKCPRCRADMKLLQLGATQVQECDRCEGLWLDVNAFETICADREEQAAVLGGASVAKSDAIRTDGNTVRYVPCPQCAQLMNRINFARCSGVIVDVCKGHGTWFDKDELSRIVEFIRGGGLSVSRAKEKAELEEERRRLRDEQVRADLRSLHPGGDDEPRILGIASTKGLLKFLLD